MTTEETRKIYYDEKNLQPIPYLEKRKTRVGEGARGMRENQFALLISKRLCNSDVIICGYQFFNNEKLVQLWNAHVVGNDTIVRLYRAGVISYTFFSCFFFLGVQFCCFVQSRSLEIPGLPVASVFRSFVSIPIHRSTRVEGHLKTVFTVLYINARRVYIFIFVVFV